MTEPQPLAVLRSTAWSTIPKSPGVYWWYFPTSTLGSLRIDELCEVSTRRLRFAPDGKVCLYHGLANDLAQRVAWQQHLGLLRVLQLHHRRREVKALRRRLGAHLASNLAVVGAGDVQQQQRVPGRRGVHHHELAPSLADDAREGLEHGGLLSAGRAQVFQR